MFRMELEMENSVKEVLHSRGINLPEEDYPVVEKMWAWISGMKRQAEGVEGGVADIDMTHLVRKGDQ